MNKKETFKEMLGRHREAKRELESSTPDYGNVDPEGKHKSVKHYTGSHHIDINDRMRNAKHYTDDDERIHHLKALAKKHPTPTSTVLYRGIGGKELMHYQKHGADSHHHIPSFLSMSTHPTQARRFGHNVMRLKVPHDTPHIHPGEHSHHPNEREVILPPGHIHITHVTKSHAGHAPMTVFHGHYKHHPLDDVQESAAWREFRKNHNDHKRKLMKSTPEGEERETEALQSYTGMFHHDMNNHLRTHKEKAAEADPAPAYHAVKDDIHHLKKLLHKHKTEQPLTVYRGMKHKFMGSMEKGEHHHHEFLSTSVKPKIAHDFATTDSKGYGHVMKIKVPSGASVIHPGKHAYYPKEREVVLHPGKLHISHSTIQHGRVAHHPNGVVVHHAHYSKDE